MSKIHRDVHLNTPINTHAHVHMQTYTRLNKHTRSLYTHIQTYRQRYASFTNSSKISICLKPQRLNSCSYHPPSQPLLIRVAAGPRLMCTLTQSLLVTVSQGKKDFRKFSHTQSLLPGSAHWLSSHKGGGSGSAIWKIEDLKLFR
jgi:hypothetical protein